MGNSRYGFIIITVNVRKDIYEIYKERMRELNTKIEKDLILHIEKQVKDYTVPQYKEYEYKNSRYVQVYFRIDKELHTRYKMRVRVYNTTPTADIVRHILEEIARE